MPLTPGSGRMPVKHSTLGTRGERYTTREYVLGFPFDLEI